MMQHLDLGRDDIQLFMGFKAYLFEGSAVMRTDLLVVGQVVDDIDTRQIGGNGLLGLFVVLKISRSGA